MSNSFLRIEENTKTEGKNKSRIVNKFVLLFAISFWIYVIIKLFLFDIDIFIFKKLLPEYVGLLDYKFIFIISMIAIFLAVKRSKIVFLWAIYIIFFPLIFMFWKVPYFIFKQKSWVLAIALINSLISSIISFKRTFIMFTTFLVSTIFILVVENKLLLYCASAIILFTLLFTYIYRLIMIFKPSKVNSFYISVLSRPSEQQFSQQLKLDESIRNLPYNQLSEKQLEKWTTNLQNTVLFNRIFLFMAKKLKNYQESKLNYAYYGFNIAGLIILTVISFSFINLAIYKIEESSFKYSDAPSFFSFFYYSFNNLLFNAVDELKAISVISQSVSMIESFLVLFMTLIFVSLLYSAKNERHTRELDEVITKFETRGHDLEGFIKKEYQIESIEDALIELQKLQAIFIKFLFKITESIK